MTWRLINTAPKDGTEILVFKHNKSHPTWPNKYNGHIILVAKYIGRDEIDPY